MSRFDGPAVIAGVLVALGLIVPVALVARLVSGGELSDAWDSAFTIYILAATFVGGGVTGRRAPDTPMIHGAAAGAITYIGARIVSALASGEMPNVLGVLFALILFAAVGAIGGLVSTLLVARSTERRR